LIQWAVPLLAGFYGLLIGSFLNVCSLRWPVDESVVRPRSRCPKCETLIVWYDNVPVFSWLVLRGKCRNCSNPVSIQYPMVELANGLMWAAMFALHGPTWEALRGAIFLTIIFGISISDARFYIIPDEFSLGGTVIGLSMAFLPGGIDWLAALIGAALGYGVLWFVGAAGTWIIKKLSPGRLEEAGVDQAMGGGDIKMMMMVGAFLGAWGVALTIFLGSVLALVTVLGRSVPAALSRDEDGTMEMGRLIPFGVFLAGGGAISYVWGDPIVAWYVTSLLGLPM
jgi:leader peptidase (prepilin peptidase)/N-methyltransferase